jgi:hypothetical protein
MTEAARQQRFSLITDKSLADLRKLIGVPIEDTLEPWIHKATRDSVRHWGHLVTDLSLYRCFARVGMEWDLTSDASEPAGAPFLTRQAGDY